MSLVGDIGDGGLGHWPSTSLVGDIGDSGLWHSPKSPTRDIEGQCPSAAVCCHQHPPPGISKASAPVLQSVVTNIPHQGYRNPVPQSTVVNIPH
ncbi:hypothetical protein PoB_005787000 [Plakobranchus ocellatus]|uniref:Uncharacterized protein n=1 Tax=Plakobranchus ocellatus TaxID=259542 RepID=A0AAV4CIF5_9GAST|nr:hypothetical protein PoB_005787000 [Plakobranchus ocellatus]